MMGIGEVKYAPFYPPQAGEGVFGRVRRKTSPT